MHRIRLLTITLAATVVLLSILSLVSYSIKEDQARNDHYREQDEARSRGDVTFSGPYCYPDRHPQFLFAVGGLNSLMLVGVIFTRRRFWAAMLPVPSLTAFAYWFVSTQQDIAVNETGALALGTLDRYLYRASAFDVGILGLLLVILLLQSFQPIRYLKALP